MRTISIITPVYEPDPTFIEKAYESVRTQQLPEGWELEWAVQEDGKTGIAEKILPNDPIITFGRGRRGGPALTRNLALSRTRGELVKNFDCDDVLTPGAVARDIEVMTEHPDVHWTTSRVLDLMPDGTTIGFDADPPAGKLAPGDVVTRWISQGFRLSVHPTTMCVRRALLVAIGGWMAIPGSDDTGALIAASVLRPGYFRAEVGLLYRKHPGQVTAQAAHTDPDEWQARVNLIKERADALANLCES